MKNEPDHRPKDPEAVSPASDKNLQSTKSTENRGRGVTRPRNIPWRGWKDIFWRLRQELGKDRVGFVAAGVAFYLLLALVPLLGAFVALYGLIAEPAEVGQHLATLHNVLPDEMLTILEEELERVAKNQDAAGIGFLTGLLLALWGGTKATDALMTAMNVAYEERESRNFFKRKGLSLLLTLGSIFFFCLTAGILAIVPAWADAFVTPIELAMLWGRWPVLFILAMTWLAVFYRYAPSRSRPRWRWVTWGAAAATLLWLAGSVGFSLYVRFFGNYSSSYGSLGAIIVLMMWFFITAFAATLGAEINAEMEHQTARDTTTGEPQPRGQRDAFVADDLGALPSDQ